MIRIFNFIKAKRENKKNNEINEIETAYEKAILALYNINHYLRIYDTNKGENPKWAHIPFKDKTQNEIKNYPYSLDPNNWDVSEEEKARIKEWMNDCYNYANISSILFPSEKPIPTKYIINPHYLFPWFNPGSIAWRMGIGEGYSMWFHDKWNLLSEKEKTQIRHQYPNPEPYRYSWF